MEILPPITVHMPKNKVKLFFLKEIIPHRRGSHFIFEYLLNISYCQRLSLFLFQTSLEEDTFSSINIHQC